MVRLSNAIGPEDGRRPVREQKRPAGETLPEILIVTTSAEVVTDVRRAVEVRGFRMRHFQSFEEALGLIRAAGRVIPVIDGDLEGARAFIDELALSGPVRAIAIVPDRDTAEFFSGIPGLRIFTRPVSQEDLLEAVRALSGPIVESEAGAPDNMGGTLFPEAAPPSPPPPPPVRETPPTQAPPSPPAPEPEPPAGREEPVPESASGSAARLAEMVPSEPPAGIKRPVIPDLTETQADPAIPAGETGQAVAAREQLYDQTAEVLHRFISGHRSRSNPPLGEVTGIVENLLARLRESRDICLQVISRTPDFHDADRYLATHMVNVTLLAARLGMGRAYDERKLFELTLAAAVHDIGMTQLPEGLITRQGKLDQAGYSQIKQHPAFGRQILQTYAGAYPWLPDVVYQEHERHDGSGYPEAISGNDIHPYAVIIGLCDTYEALTHMRPFRDRMIPFNVLQQLIRLGGQLFPSEMVKAFIDEVSVFPIGSYVRLNTGEVCKVQEINRGYPLRPIVRVLFASDGSALEQGRSIDLKAEPMLYITGPEDIRE